MEKIVAIPISDEQPKLVASVPQVALTGNILGPAQGVVLNFPPVGDLIVAELAQAVAPAQLSTDLSNRASGWFVVKELLPAQYQLVPGFVLASVYTIGDIIKLSDMPAPVQAAWAATGSHGVYLGVQPGLPAPGFPDTLVNQGATISSLRVAVRLSLFNFSTLKTETAFQIVSETPDVVKAGAASSTAIVKFQGGRYVNDLTPPVPPIG
jgi:hypothetical protein